MSNLARHFLTTGSVSLAAAAILAACGGLKTNPVEGYRDLGGVRAYGAGPDNSPPPRVRLSPVFSVQFADANRQAIGERALAFRSGEATTYFVRSEVKLLGHAQPHELVATGLPEGISLAPVEGQPGLWQLSGTVAAVPLACGAQAPVAAKILFSWTLAANASREVIAASRADVGESDLRSERAYSVTQQGSAAQLSADPRLEREIAPGQTFSIKIESLATTAQFPPTLALEGSDDVEFAGGVRSPRALNADGTAWEWSLQAKVGTTARAARFTVSATNTCVGQVAARLEGVNVRFSAAAAGDDAATRSGTDHAPAAADGDAPVAAPGPASAQGERAAGRNPPARPPDRRPPKIRP